MDDKAPAATPEWLTVAEVATLLRVKPFTIARMLNEEALPGAYFGTREGWRVRRVDVETLRGKLAGPEEGKETHNEQ